MHLINLIETADDGKNCPKTECGKREYLTRRSAGRTLSICPNGHSWDAIELAAQRQKSQRAKKEESIFSESYDFLRNQTIIPEPARQRQPGERPGEVFRSPHPTFVDPLKDEADSYSRRQLEQQYERMRRFPTIKLSSETLKAMQDTGYFSPRETKPDRLLGIPIVLDETIPPGLYVWSVGIEFENPFERFLKAMTKSVAEGFGLNPAVLLK